jgi:hypothetical protein
VMLIAKYAKVFPRTGTLPFLTTFLGLAKKVWTCRPVHGKHFPHLPQKGKETVKKYAAGYCGLPKEVSGGLAPARVT